MSKVAAMEANKEVAASAEVSQRPDPFNLADEQIRRLIYETHGCPDDSFDADALFVIVENILKRSTQIVDKVMQEDDKVTLAKLDENIPKANFNVPMGILKKIGSELLCCKALDAEIAHETTLTILKKLRYYSWEAKAVLTLAAFAGEFGSLLHLVQLDQSNTHNQFTKSLQILKGSPVLAKSSELYHKHRVAIVALNNLIKETLEVMETIFELEKLSIYDPKSIAELPIAVDVYWIIMTVIACASKVTILINDEDKPYELSPYKRKVQDILNTLTTQLTDFRLMKDEFNPFNESDDKIIERICTKTHVDDADETFKCFPLFLVVKSILEHSSQFLDEEIGEKPEKDKTRGRVPSNINFNLPLLVLQQIAAELTSFNQTGPKVNSHRTTLKILEKLQQYNSWEAKAVLALLAFAMGFRDFSSSLSQTPRSSADHLEVPQSLEIIKNVLVFTRPSSDIVQKFEERVHGELEILNKCIKIIVQVMETIIKLEKLSSIYDKESHSSTESQKALVVHSCWVIMAIAACATKITSLTSNVDNKPQGHLENYTKTMHSILDSLTKKLNALTEEAKLYWDVTEISAAPSNTVEVLQVMCKPTSPMLYDMSAKKWVKIDSVMGGKAAFIFISGMNISDDDICLMKETQNKIDRDMHSKFRILWAPLWEDSWKEAGSLIAKQREKMTWYIIPFTSIRPIAMRFAKEEWNYKGQTMLVVMNEQGIVENFNAYELLRRWGMEAFPFDKEAERRMSDRINWPKTVVGNMNFTDLKEWIKDEDRCIFLYGGSNEAWTKKFQETIKTVEQHLSTSGSEAKISWFCIGKTAEKYSDDVKEATNVSSQFWSGVEKWILDTEDDKRFESETKQIQTLLSYKYQEGWVLLCKGPQAVVSGHGETMLKALEEFKSDCEKGLVKIDQKSGTFEKVFEEYHTRIINKNGARCCQFQIEGCHGNQIKEKKCTVCSTSMKVKIFYECFHEGTPMAAHR